jgi:hypothetical protein
MAGRDDRQRIGKHAARLLGAGFGQPDIQPEDSRTLGDKTAIAKQLERGKLQLAPPQPRLQGDVRPDARRFA